jgi:hypothetical protein
MSTRVDQFIEMLQKYPSNGSVSNPGKDRDLNFDIEHAPSHRSNHLRGYLNARLNTAKALLIAEAPGYQGAKFSGIPMTCERTLLGYRGGVSRADVFAEITERHRTSRHEASEKQAVKVLGFVNRLRPTSGRLWLNEGYRRKLYCGMFLHFIHTKLRTH